MKLYYIKSYMNVKLYILVLRIIIQRILLNRRTLDFVYLMIKITRTNVTLRLYS